MISDISDDTFDPAQLLGRRRVKKPSPITYTEAPEVPETPEPAPVAEAPEATEPRQVEESQPSRSLWASINELVTDWRLPVFFGILIMLVCLFVLLSAGSYFYNLTHDQSALLSGVTQPGQIANSGGPLGAWTAHWLIHDWLGLGAFVMVFYLFMCGLALVGYKKLNFWKLTFRCLMVAIAVSVVGGFITYSISSPVYWGGRHGHYLNERLMEVSGIWGAGALSLIMVAIVILLALNTLKDWFKAGQRGMARWKAHRAQTIKQQQQKAAEREENSQSTPDDEEPDEPEDSDDIAEHSEETEETKAPQSHEEPEEPIKPIFDTNPFTFPFSQNSEPSKPEDSSEPAQPEEPEEPEEQPLYDHRSALPDYKFPSTQLLIERELATGNVDKEEMEANKERIIKTLNDYGIPISHITATVGATVTLYEIIPAEGVRIAKIKRLEDDIALSLSALGIRIIAPIPGKGTIGIEVPNKDPQTVSIRSVLESQKFKDSHMELPMAMGTTISNDIFMADLCKMPHLLVAGATGMGKSVGLNAIIASLLYKKHPTELKFVLVDPKMVEFSLYAKIENQYLAKLPDEEDAIITDPAKVVATLNSLCVEMDQRYALLKDAGLRNIKEYNDKFSQQRLSPADGHRYLPYIVVIVDEFADLIMTAGKEVETPIARIAQKARAVGMHMILATQRPSTNVITGVIKANFPGRVAFRVFQMVDSRTILDRPGANQLIGRGDMLFSNNGKIDRVQCAFIDTPEVENLCHFISRQPSTGSAYELPEYVPDSEGASSGNAPSDRDPLFEEIALYVASSATASTSSLQRRWSIGYNRAGKIMDQMEAAGIVGPANGGKPRQVLVDTGYVQNLFN